MHWARVEFIKSVLLQMMIIYPKMQNKKKRLLLFVIHSRVQVERNGFLSIPHRHCARGTKPELRGDPSPITTVIIRSLCECAKDFPTDHHVLSFRFFLFAFRDIFAWLEQLIYCRVMGAKILNKFKRALTHSLFGVRVLCRRCPAV